MSKNTNSDKEQAPPKPKVLFKMNFDIWDDGEITRDLSEKIQGERGAPKAWRLEPREFALSIKQVVTDKVKLFGAILAALDITEDEMKKAYSLDKATQAKADKIASVFGSTDEKVSKNKDEKDDFNFEEEA